jgi:hypothetical protein
MGTTLGKAAAGDVGFRLGLHAEHIRDFRDGQLTRRSPG